MDSITQVALGAAIGDMVLGEKAGKKAALWGGLAGLIPDLDILFRPLYRQSEYLLFHRGLSHSIIFTLLLAPVLAWIIFHIHKKSDISFNRWWLLTFLALFTHPLLDIMTVYGTGFFEPFSAQRLSLAAISIVDPIYSLPLFIPLLVILTTGRTKLLGKIFLACFVFSHLYLAGTLINSRYMHNLFVLNLQQQNITYKKILVAPSILNNILWYGVAVDNDNAWIGFYSHMDSDTEITFKKVSRNRHLSREVEAKDFMNLERFSKGFFAMEKRADGIYFSDMRFGFTDKNTFTFNYNFSMPEKRPFITDVTEEDLSRLWDRIVGRE